MAGMEAGGAVEAKQALARAAGLERELHRLAKTTSFFDPSMRSLRAQLRDQYATVLFSDYKLAKAKDVEALLWKSVFYKPIEEFRRRIRKAHESGPAAAELLHKATKTLGGFLADAATFYKHLVMRLQATYRSLGIQLELPPGVQAPQDASGPSKQVDASGSVARSLLFLGDLTRYSVLYSAGLGKKMSENDWSPAAKFYEQAARVHVHIGQPHNQLAVLATYEEDELGAVYHYARALAVGAPFLTARDNLVLLFEKSRQRAALLERPGSSSGRGGRGRAGRGRGGGAPRVPPAAAMATRYVRLVGILFTKTSLETLGGLADTAAADLSAALSGDASNPRGAAPSRELLLRLAAVLAFAAHNVAWAPPGHSPGYSEMVQRAVLARGAMAVAHSFLAALTSALHGAPTLSGHPALPALHVGLQWLAAHPAHALPDDPDAPELAARAAFLTAAAALLPALRSDAATTAPGGAPLPEDVTLRGFLPLAPAHERLSGWDAPSDLAGLRLARIVADLEAIADHLGSFAEASSQKASWRALASTKEWKALKSAVEEFRLAVAGDANGGGDGLDGDHDGGNDVAEAAGEEAMANDVAATASGSASPALDPMEEDELEEEIILFRPRAQAAAPQVAAPTSTAPTALAVQAAQATQQHQTQQHLGQPIPAATAPIAAGAVPVMLPAGDGGFKNPWGTAAASAPPQPQYSLPWMQGIQLGFGGSATDLPSDGAGTDASPINRFLGNGAATIAAEMEDMGNSLVAGLGLESNQPQRDPIAAPPRKLPSSSNLLKPGSLFPAPPQPDMQPGGAFGPLAPPANGTAGGSFFSSGATVLGFQPSAPPPGASLSAAQMAQPAAATSDLGDGYGWLDALEARATSAAPQGVTGYAGQAPSRQADGRGHPGGGAYAP
mmetsp:Transcript_14539/g.37296  ORF Transcript_14539/g.37296 Transcript_14539/m.37296 type:complete len:900 (+) Transcript_14539:268-2967(+)